MATYTGFIRFANPGYPDSIEEIDVVANTTEEARQRIQQELDDDYEPGGIIAHIEQRMGLFA
ncbi:hypothetical protein RZO50_03810 [Microbacterium sp. SSW1-59]|uniref:hypothetical protein n=1 Tax=Microbacterium xanthum TaxID=3079794 RepID=UPI002AD5B213|nr:hypothetical protein [Microbacterium sp. SSW1-59]MDZ8200623.1 hypothetical protein [Microbacterium sp. SSW1-59]